MTTGERLKLSREFRGVSRRRLCRMTDIAYSTLVELERSDGTGHLDTWMRIADALGTTVSGLIGDDDG